ncbi:MAG: class I SAM-dependent methyltransferase [Nanoarchaeota archaeon]|nr:class I SAM-dependent methyltransferase [Nanoarchaeota archaeon]
MTIIRTINSEVDIRKGLNRNFKLNRVFEQNSFYLSSGAGAYYNINSELRLHHKKKNDWKTEYNFLKKNFLKKNQNIAFISLGCGNGGREKEILAKAQEEGYNLKYFGVDCSMSMIALAVDNLRNKSYKKDFICADFTSVDFRIELENIVGEFDKKIFVFFGNTLANVPQNYIADTLRNLLKKDDILWLDVATRDDLSESTAGDLFENYLNYIKNEDYIKFFTSPLEKIGVNLNSGELIMEMKKENSLNALQFQYGFHLNKKIEVKVDNEYITLIPGDNIELINTRIYDVTSLISFFEARHFKLIDNIKTGGFTEICFKKE